MPLRLPSLGKLHLSGILAWLVWLFVHLMYIVEFENRLLVFIQWGIQYVTFNRGARLITGEQRNVPDPAHEAEPATEVRAAPPPAPVRYR